MLNEAGQGGEAGEDSYNNDGLGLIGAVPNRMSKQPSRAYNLLG